MKRRHSGQSAVATGVVVDFPLDPVLATTQITSDIPAVTLSGSQTLLGKAAVREFGARRDGERQIVALRSSSKQRAVLASHG